MDLRKKFIIKCKAEKITLKLFTDTFRAQHIDIDKKFQSMQRGMTKQEHEELLKRTGKAQYLEDLGVNEEGHIYQEVNNSVSNNKELIFKSDRKFEGGEDEEEVKGGEDGSLLNKDKTKVAS